MKIYLRIAKNTSRKGGFIVDASTKVDNTPLYRMVGYQTKEYLPTVSFAIEMGLEDGLFKKAEQVVAKLNLKAEDVVVNDIGVVEV